MAVQIRSNIPALEKAIQEARREGLRKVGLILEAKMAEKVSSGSIPPPLQPATIKRKGSSATLVDTGELLEHISSELTEDGSRVKAGVFGESRALIGMVHEFGSKKKNIPERSFMRSTAAEVKDDVRGVVVEAVKKAVDRSALK